MRINNTRTLLQLMEVLRGENDSGQKKKEQPSNSQQDALLNFLSRLDSSLRRDIIRTWVNYNLPLDLKQLEQLLSFLENTGSDKRSYPQLLAFAFLLKNKLPLLPALIDGLARNLDFGRSAAAELNAAVELNRGGDIMSILARLANYQGKSGNAPVSSAGPSPAAGQVQETDLQLTGNSNTDLNPGRVSELDAELKTDLRSALDPADDSMQTLRDRQGMSPGVNKAPSGTPSSLVLITGKLCINAGLPPEELARILEEYPAGLGEVLTALKEQEGRELTGLENRLLAQQLLNIRGDGLLLNLELPLFFPGQKGLIPAYLQIWQNERETDQEKDAGDWKPAYRICFFISLPSRGRVRADLLYRPGRLKTNFKSSSPGTVELIREALPRLKERLSGLGLIVEEATVGLLSREETDLERELIRPLLGVEESERVDGFTHFDLRI